MIFNWRKEEVGGEGKEEGKAIWAQSICYTLQLKYFPKTHVLREGNQLMVLLGGTETFRWGSWWKEVRLL